MPGMTRPRWMAPIAVYVVPPGVLLVLSALLGRQQDELQKGLWGAAFVSLIPSTFVAARIQLRNVSGSWGAGPALKLHAVGSFAFGVWWGLSQRLLEVLSPADSSSSDFWFLLTAASAWPLVFVVGLAPLALAVWVTGRGRKRATRSPSS